MGRLSCILNDEAYAVLKLIIENSAAEGDVAEFILRSAVQAAPLPGIKAAPCSSKEYRIVVGRWGALLEIMLQDPNFENKLSYEVHNLFFQFIMMIFCSTFNASTGLPDPCPTDTQCQYMDETHPKTIWKFLERAPTST